MDQLWGCRSEWWTVKKASRCFYCLFCVAHKAAGTRERTLSREWNYRIFLFTLSLGNAAGFSQGVWTLTVLVWPSGLVRKCQDRKQKKHWSMLGSCLSFVGMGQVWKYCETRCYFYNSASLCFSAVMLFVCVMLAQDWQCHFNDLKLKVLNRDNFAIKPLSLSHRAFAWVLLLLGGICQCDAVLVCLGGHSTAMGYRC